MLCVFYGKTRTGLLVFTYKTLLKTVKYLFKAALIMCTSPSKKTRLAGWSDIQRDGSFEALCMTQHIWNVQKNSLNSDFAQFSGILFFLFSVRII